MVISDSKVNLASKRLYNETFSQGRFTSARNGRNQIYAQSGANFSSSFATAENYSNNSSFYSNSGGYSMGESTRSTAYYGLFAYSRNAKLVADSKDMEPIGQSVSGETDAKMTDASENVRLSTVSYKNPTYIYNTARKRIFISLLEFIHQLSFRGQFENNYGYNSLSGISNIFNTSNTMNTSYISNSSNSLSITNSSDASIWSIKQTYSTFYGEAEYTSFSGKGTVVTSEGQEISFDVNMEMSRSYMEQTSISYITKFPQILTDPLIINLDCDAAAIQDKTFLFDLDCDGKQEEIAALAPGSGYLALDINGDGIINDGSELFGPTSGDGFKDLSAYDSDGNGWIDETDPIYKQLKVWTTDINGAPVLMSLKEADVGAIYLGSSKTQFDLKDANNNLKGQVRSSGIYLHEDGTAGTVQQVDF